jgi:hypothetical protein
VRSIPLCEAVLLVTSDASWGNCADLCSQGAYMILLAGKEINDGKWATISPLRWRSHKLERQTQSTLGAELMSLSRALAEGNWMRSMFAEAMHENYTLETDANYRNELAMVATIDNKPVYDHVHGDGVVVKDKRLAIDMLIVKRDVNAENIHLRWIDTRQMLCDTLTKSSAPADLLRTVLRTGKYIIVEEKDMLVQKEQERLDRQQRQQQKKKKKDTPREQQQGTSKTSKQHEPQANNKNNSTDLQATTLTHATTDDDP